MDWDAVEERMVEAAREKLTVKLQGAPVTAPVRAMLEEVAEESVRAAVQSVRG